MKQKHVDAAREVRLWLGQIIVPVMTTGAILMSNDDIRYAAKNKAERIKQSVLNKLGK